MKTKKVTCLCSKACMKMSRTVPIATTFAITRNSKKKRQKNRLNKKKSQPVFQGQHPKSTNDLWIARRFAIVPFLIRQDISLGIYEALIHSQSIPTNLTEASNENKKKINTRNNVTIGARHPALPRRFSTRCFSCLYFSPNTPHDRHFSLSHFESFD